ncbi:MAG: GntR family transcriptional regulator [Bacteroidetes bacterium]|nr:GntR family transcriptional regulator [Bacteroidota bacterium]
MEFKDNEAIYVQIASFVCDNILRGRWPEGERILSVRDLAVELQVNPNTVMRAYDFLQSLDVLYNKRGHGLFIAENGIEKVKKYYKNNFFENHLPEVFKNMYLLEISPEEIAKKYSEFVKGENLKKKGNKNENK